MENHAASLNMECSLAVQAINGRLDQDRMALLAAIAKSGSLSKAASTLGIAYKTAWAWLDALNNAAEEPLVISSHGGSSGGGSVLTSAGTRLLEQYTQMVELHLRLQKEMEAHHSVSTDLNAFLSRIAFRTSARNQLHGRVVCVRGDRVQSWIEIRMPSGLSLHARTSHASVLEMGIAPGLELSALFKATVVQVEPWSDTSIMLNHEYRLGNRWSGQVVRIQREDDVVTGERNSLEVIVDIGGGLLLAALVDGQVWQKVCRVDPAKVTISIDPNHILLVRTC